MARKICTKNHHDGRFQKSKDSEYVLLNKESHGNEDAHHPSFFVPVKNYKPMFLMRSENQKLTFYLSTTIVLPCVLGPHLFPHKTWTRYYCWYFGQCLDTTSFRENFGQHRSTIFLLVLQLRLRSQLVILPFIHFQILWIRLRCNVIPKHSCMVYTTCSIMNEMDTTWSKLTLADLYS